MSMSDWAEKEVEIACEREKSHSEDTWFDIVEFDVLKNDWKI